MSLTSDTPGRSLLIAGCGDGSVRLYIWQVFFISQDIPTGADSCVMSLTSDTSGRSLLIAGCGDGSVRLFDKFSLFPRIYQPGADSYMGSAVAQW